MSKRGENIYKRKDGRWEGRYIKERSADGKARYAYVYGKSYADAKQKLLDRRIAQAQNIDCSPSHTKYGDILRNWIAMSRVHIKESTYSRYVHLANVHILPYLGELPTDKLTTQTVEKHISFLLNKGRVDKKGGLAPKTVSDILTLIKGSIDYANCSGYSVNCYLDRLTVKKTQLDMRVLSIDEQHRLCDILMRDMNLTKFGVLLCMYTGIRIGEVCALKWESIDFSEGILSIRETLQRIQATDVGACKKTKIVITEPKSKKAIRDIPLPGFVLEYAASLKHNNFLIYSEANSAADLANRLIDSVEVEGKATGSALTAVDVSDFAMAPAQNIFASPWIFNNILLYKARDLRFWSGKAAPVHLQRLKHLMTMREFRGVFKFPIDDEKLIGLDSKKVLANRERLHQSIIAEGNFKVGIIQNVSMSGKSANAHAGIPLNDFTKHGLIVGMPGSGKTNFSLGLLLQFWKDFHIPFLAIEPTKSEYRSLIDAIPNLQIFTPGKAAVSPYIINPFVPPKGVTVESFVPSLMSAFKAAYAL